MATCLRTRAFQVCAETTCLRTRAFPEGPWLPVQRREFFRWVHDYLSRVKSFSGGSMATLQEQELSCGSMAIRPRTRAFKVCPETTCPRTRAFQVGPWLPVQRRELFRGVQ